MTVEVGAHEGESVQRLVLIVVLVLAAAACADSGPEVTEVTPDPTPTAVDSPTAPDSPSPSPTSEPAAAGDGSQAVTEYLSAMVSGDLDTMETMHDHVAEGSPAETYADFQVGLARAQRQSGISLEGGSTREVEGGVEMCSGGSCSTFSDFEVTDGRLVAFIVDGNAISERLVTGGETINASGVTGTLVAAYQTVSSNELIVVADINNGRDDQAHLNIYSAEYVDEGGAQSTATDALGAIELRPGSSTTVAVIFEGASPGGTAYIPGTSANFEESFELQLTVATTG